MNDNTSNTESETKPRSPMNGIRRAFITLGIVALFMLVFGQILPRVMFDAPEAEPATLQNVSPQQDRATTEELLALRQRLDRLEARLSAQETLLTTTAPDGITAPASQPEPDLAAAETLKTWQADMEEKINRLQATAQATPASSPASASADEARLAALEARIANQQQAFATIQLQADEKVALVLALAQLKEQAARGAVYQPALQSVAAMLTTREDLQPLLQSLATHAARGVTTPERSKAEFEPLLRRALEASSTQTSKNPLGSLVSIRRTGLPEGTSDEAVLARAETHLLAGDMAGCLRQLEALSSEAAPIFAPWIENARAYRRVQDDMDALELAALRPAPATDAAPPPAQGTTTEATTP
ncbi:MAG: hypothetical protein SFW63_05960 [Alphaproteobacteria bacterium]|nr:hypothetical protein [Alphaproteobacteria bacterium]